MGSPGPRQVHTTAANTGLVTPSVVVCVPVQVAGQVGSVPTFVVPAVVTNSTLPLESVRTSPVSVMSCAFQRPGPIRKPRLFISAEPANVSGVPRIADG